MNLYELINNYRPGSNDWDWTSEYLDLISRDWAKIDSLMVSISEEGIKTPVLLGPDGRVWDGHHRIVAALCLGITEIPVEYGKETPVKLVQKTPPENPARVLVTLTVVAEVPLANFDGIDDASALGEEIQSYADSDWGGDLRTSTEEVIQHYITEVEVELKDLP